MRPFLALLAGLLSFALLGAVLVWLAPEPGPAYAWERPPRRLLLMRNPAAPFPGAQVLLEGDRLRARYADRSTTFLEVHGSDAAARAAFERAVAAIPRDARNLDDRGDLVLHEHAGDPLPFRLHVLAGEAVIEVHAPTDATRTQRLVQVPDLKSRPPGPSPFEWLREHWLRIAVVVLLYVALLVPLLRRIWRGPPARLSA